MKNKRFLRKTQSALDLSEGILENLPNIILYGTSTVEIDNFKGLLDFSTSSVRINTTDSILRIDGSELHISFLTDESIGIKGKIISVSFE